MTYKGLAKFNAKAENFITYPLTGNFMKDEFGIYGYYKARNGNLFLGQAQRFTFFDPLSLTQNHSEYPLLITEVSLFDQPLKLNTSLSKLPDIELSYRQNMLTINYCALNYHRSGDTRYSYRLIGLEEEWVDAGTNRQVTYTYLQPGDYTFEVRAVNFVGRLSEQTASLNIVILPPWWATWWFRSIIVLILIVLFYAIYRMRLSKILQMERMRVQIASDLHDDIGASLTRIAVHSEIIQSTGNSDSIRRSSGRIGVMSREIITTLSDIVWSIDARNDTVGDLLDRMRDFLDTVFPPGSIKIDFQTQGLHLNQKIAQEMRQNVYLIFKEAVNNAARHSDGSEIRIRIINGNGIFQMSIADNGSGFDLNKKTAGHHGLENMRMRAERIGGTLRIESNHGTRIVLETKSI
jgi:two-component sensor histidine kinase